jgi:nucleoside-diphosphate-sugar epimerase
MKNKKILIIGGTGFFGKSFLKLFLNKSLDKWGISKVLIMSRSPEILNKTFGKKLKKVVLYKMDMALANDLPLCDYIIHAATSTDQRVYKKNFFNIKKNNLENISNFLRIIKKKKFRKTKIVYMSSGTVYGSNKSLKKIKETDPILPIKKNCSDYYNNNLYRFIKIISEDLIFDFNKKLKMKIAIARCFAFVGEFLPLNRHYFIGNLLYSILNNKKLIINNSNLKKVFRSYLYADELVEWIMKILTGANNKTEVFNVGSDQSISLFNLTQFFKSSYNLKNKRYIIKKYSKMADLDFYVPCINKMKRRFKLSIKINLKKSIRKTYQELNN